MIELYEDWSGNRVAHEPGRGNESVVVKLFRANSLRQHGHRPIIYWGGRSAVDTDGWFLGGGNDWKNPVVNWFGLDKGDGSEFTGDAFKQMLDAQMSMAKVRCRSPWDDLWGHVNVPSEDPAPNHEVPYWKRIHHRLWIFQRIPLDKYMVRTTTLEGNGVKATEDVLKAIEKLNK